MCSSDLTVTDSVSQSYVGEFVFGILPPTLQTTLTTPNKTLTQYELATPFTPVTASGGYGTLTYAVSSGTLPNGLTLNPNNGQITGTPSVKVTNSPITITVTDTASPPQSSNQTFNLAVTISPIPPLQAVLAQSTYALNLGQFYSFFPVLGFGGISPYIYNTQSVLPNGLSFNTTTGEISGTPTEVSNANTIIITVQDTVPLSATQSFNVSVISVASAVDTVARSLAQQAYNQALQNAQLANAAQQQRFNEQNKPLMYAVINGQYLLANTPELEKAKEKVIIGVDYAYSYTQQQFGRLKAENFALYEIVGDWRNRVSKYCSNRLADLKRQARAIVNEGKQRERSATADFSHRLTDVFEDLRIKCKNANKRGDETANEKKFSEAKVAFMTVWNRV